jgi:aminobutyraldehyde dehydrogenase
MDTQMLIGNRFEAGTEAEEKIFNPRTGETILNLPEASSIQIEAAVNAAEKAFATWSRTTPAERAGYLLKIADRIEAEADGFAALEAINCGKPINAVKNDEMPAIIDCYRFFAGAARCVPASAAGEYMAGHTSMIRRDPIGIVASIAPWNYPLMMMAWKLAPAIAGGNTVIFKPSEQTPLTALEDGKNSCRCASGRGRQHRARSRCDHRQRTDQSSQGQYDLHHRRRGHGQEDHAGRLTDGEAHPPGTGRQGAGHRFRRCEPGSGRRRACAPSVITIPARTARPPAGSTRMRRIYDRFVANLASEVSKIAYAQADDEQNEIGPLISMRQKDRVAGFVERALEQPHMEIGRRRQGA